MTDIRPFWIAGRAESEARAASVRAAVQFSGTPGFTVAPGYSKVGWNASDTHELSFSDCRVPAANLLGERGRGYAQFLSILDEGRIAIASACVLNGGLFPETHRARPVQKLLATPVIGAVLLGTVQQVVTVTISSELNVLVVGLLLVFFVVAAPDGVLGLVKKWKQSSK